MLAVAIPSEWLNKCTPHPWVVCMVKMGRNPVRSTVSGYCEMSGNVANRLVSPWGSTIKLPWVHTAIFDTHPDMTWGVVKTNKQTIWNEIHYLAGASVHILQTLVTLRTVHTLCGVHRVWDALFVCGAPVVCGSHLVCISLGNAIKSSSVHGMSQVSSCAMIVSMVWLKCEILCLERESNPHLWHSEPVCYHYTT